MPDANMSGSGEGMEKPEQLYTTGGGGTGTPTAGNCLAISYKVKHAHVI